MMGGVGPIIIETEARFFAMVLDHDVCLDGTVFRERVSTNFSLVREDA